MSYWWWISLSGALIRSIWNNFVSTIAPDALAPHGAKPSAALVLCEIGWSLFSMKQNLYCLWYLSIEK